MLYYWEKSAYVEITMIAGDRVEGSGCQESDRGKKTDDEDTIAIELGYYNYNCN